MSADSPTPAAPAGSGAERRIDAMLADLVERRAIGVIGPLDELLDAIVAQRARAEAAERERDTISCNAIPTWPACEDGLDRQQHNDPVCWGCYSAEKAIRREVESQLSAATAREAGLRKDAERWRYVRDWYTWLRRSADIGSDERGNPLTELRTYFEVRVPNGSNLSCAAMLDHAIDAAPASLAAPEGGTET